MTTKREGPWAKMPNSRLKHAMECHVVRIETTKTTETRRYWRCECGAKGWAPRH